MIEAAMQFWAVRELDNTDLQHGVYGDAMKEAINTYTYAYEIVLKKHEALQIPNHYWVSWDCLFCTITIMDVNDSAQILCSPVLE